MEYDCEGKLNSRKRYDVHRICPLSMLLDGKFRKAMHPNRSNGATSFDGHFISLSTLSRQAPLTVDYKSLSVLKSGSQSQSDVGFFFE